MKLEEYVKTVEEQIRYTKIRDHIGMELKNHIIDQAEDYESSGMSHEDAISQAVAEMGDPVEVGVEMDKIHHPSMPWFAISAVTIISIFGLITQFMLRRELVLAPSTYRFTPHHQLFAVLIGLAIMMCICLLDYTAFVKVASILTAILMICVSISDKVYYNNTVQLAIFPLHVQTSVICMLFIPLYAALLYRCRIRQSVFNSSSCRLALTVFSITILPPIIILSKSPSLTYVGIMFLIMLVLLSKAVKDGWLTKHRKAWLSVIWGSVLFMIIALCVYFATSAPRYQRDRIRAFLHIGDYNRNISYISDVTARILGGCNWFGRSSEAVSAVRNMLPAYNTDYILVSISAMYGKAVSCILIAVLIAALVLLMRGCLRGRSLSGQVIGTGCCGALFMQTVLGTLMNMTIFPPSAAFFPLLSYGVQNTIVSYILLGLILSIYRHKQVVFEPSGAAAGNDHIKTIISIK